ncbi:hypothetical protein [Candidatus Chlorohelix sp.]|uniref:hypothetical protein n=1 Tax=Candidatus Chlorohelix sp. TaxID=3139201 RepID=UPI00306824D6
MSQENKPEDIDYPFPIAVEDTPYDPPTTYTYQPQPAAQPVYSYQPPPVTAPQPAYSYQPTPIGAVDAANKPMPPVRTGANTTAVEVTVGIITFLVLLAIIALMIYLVWWK